MKHVPSPAALVTAAVAALLGAGGLLALQIVLGLEYTAGGTAGTRWSMIGAMVTLALLPVFLAIAWRVGASFIAVSIGVSFAAFLFYSLPATSGRTGEIKEASAARETKHAEDKARVEADYEATKLLVAESNKWQPKACAGGPGKDCKSATFVLNQRQASLEKLTKQLEAFQASPTGDVGSTLWAWALSWAGVTAGAIRKGSVIAFAIGLDFAIWSLVALSEYLIALALRIAREQREASQETERGCVEQEARLRQDVGNRSAQEEADRWNVRKPWPGQLRQPSVKETLQTSFAVAGLLDNDGNSGNPGAVGGQPKRRDNPGNSGNGGGNRRGPKPDNPSNAGPNSGHMFSRDEAESDLLWLLATGATIGSQDELANRWTVDKGTVSKWLKNMRNRRLIPAAQRVGRCHRLVAAE